MHQEFRDSLNGYLWLKRSHEIVVQACGLTLRLDLRGFCSQVHSPLGWLLPRESNSKENKVEISQTEATDFL